MGVNVLHKHCRSGKAFLLIGQCAEKERETAALWPNPCECAADRPASACPIRLRQAN